MTEFPDLMRKKCGVFKLEFDDLRYFINTS